VVIGLLYLRAGLAICTSRFPQPAGCLRLHLRNWKKLRESTIRSRVGSGGARACRTPGRRGRLVSADAASARALLKRKTSAGSEVAQGYRSKRVPALAGKLIFAKYQGRSY
jgi:hypothetical protein